MAIRNPHQDHTQRAKCLDLFVIQTAQHFTHF
jgi:hypothetical protein